MITVDSKKENNNTLTLKQRFIKISENYQNENYLVSEKLALSTNAIFPNNEFVWRMLVDIYEKQNKKFKAINACLQLIKLVPQDFTAYTNLGIFYIETAQLIKAEEALRKAIELNSYDFFTQYNLGITLIDLGKFQEAKLRLTTAKAIDSNHAEVHYKLGFVLYKLGKINESELSYKQALTIDPQNFLILNSLGVVLRDLKQYNESESIFKKAIICKPNYFEANFNLALLYKQSNDFKKAESYYLKSIKIKPNYSSYNNLGNIYRQVGNSNKAISNFIDAIKLKPNLGEAWDNLYYPMQIKKSQKNYNKNHLSELFKKKLNIVNNEYLSILKYKLCIGGIKSGCYFNKAIKSINKKKNIEIKNIKSLNNVSKENKVCSQNIIALLNFGRSGTGLLHSLIDNHSEISTLPSIYFSQFFDNLVWEKITANGWTNIVDNFIAAYPILFDARSSSPVASKGGFIENIGIKEGMTSLGEHKNEFLYIDKNLFKKELISLIMKRNHLDQIIFFKLVHLAYEKAINNFQKKKILFYHIHNPSNYALFNFINLTPKAKWLIMVRDPIESCESWISSNIKENNYNDAAKKIVTMLFDVNNSLYLNKDAVGLRLEDLKNYPKNTISSLCAWMKIKEDESLYEMTAQGKKWWGDIDSKHMSAFGNINKSKVGSVFSNNDRFILNTLFYPFSSSFGYVEKDIKKFKKDLNEIRPMLNEAFGFEKAIINRMNINMEEFKNLEMFLYLRTKLIERWEILNKFHTYPDMLKPLKINNN